MTSKCTVQKGEWRKQGFQAEVRTSQLAPSTPTGTPTTLDQSREDCRGYSYTDLK